MPQEVQDSVDDTTDQDTDHNKEPEVTELALDDELVQKLHASFNVFPGIQGYGYRSFYDIMNGDDDELKESAKIVQILASVETAKCKMSAEHETSYDQIGFCVDGGIAAEKFKEIYGYDIIHVSVSDYGFCGGTEYFTEYDQYFNGTACGGAGPSSLKKWLYRAEKDENHIYIYDLAEIWAAEFADENSYEAIRNIHCHTDMKCSSIVSERKDGELMDIPSNVVLVEDVDDVDRYDASLTKVYFSKYADQLDQYKWTFTQNSDGNYVFTGLEKIN